MGKHCSNPQCFKEKNYKTKLSTSSIVKKKKFNKNSFEKKRQFWKKKGKKNIWEKLKLNSQPAQYWKNKFDKDNLKNLAGKHCSNL